jgi:hypothetical protein
MRCAGWIIDWLPAGGLGQAAHLPKRPDLSGRQPKVFVGMFATTQERYNVRVSKLRNYYGLNHSWPWTKWCDGTDRAGFLPFAPLWVGMTAFTKAFQHPVREASAEIER